MPSRRFVRSWSARRLVGLCSVALVAATLPASALAIGGSGSISGTVFDVNGAPAADVWVSACSTTCDSAVTAANGTYVINGLGAGTYRVGIEDLTGHVPGGYATASGLTTAAAAAALVTVAGVPVTFDVHAPAGTIISGVITAQAGGPVAGAFAEACLVVAVPVDASFAPCGFTSTGADGTYSLTVLPGAYRVLVQDSGKIYAAGYYSTAGYVFAKRLATAIAVGTTTVTGISMALPAGASIAGTVTDNLGAPVETISAEACLTTDLLSCAFDFTLSDGSYSITRLPAGSYYVIFQDAAAEHPAGYYSTAGFTGDSSQATPVVVGATGATGIDARFPLGRLVSGVVTGATGAPVSVDVSDCTGTICMQLMTTGTDGAYTVNLAPGKHFLHVSDRTGANLSGYYSTAGVANAAHATALTIAATDLTGINLKLRRIVGGVHPGTTHSGKYVTSTVVAKGTYATARFNLGKTFAGSKVAILRAVKSGSGTWSTYKKVATVVVATDGYAYYSTKISGSFGFRASATDALIPAVQVNSAPVFARSK